MTTPVSNPYEWAPIQRIIALAYAGGRWDAASKDGFRDLPVDSRRFADRAVAEGVELDGYRALYELMARGETTETQTNYQSRKDAA